MSGIKNLKSGTSPPKDAGNSDLHGVQVNLSWDEEARVCSTDDRSSSPSGAKEE